MAVHTGSQGLVKVGGNTVAEVTAFTLETVADVIESTQLSDSAKSFEASRTSFTATIECAFDETDTNGQLALTEGQSVSLFLHPEGNDSGDYVLQGTAIVTGNSVSVTMDDLIRLSISVQGSGGITRTTV
ncbi:MAG TPA: hypothetical protein DCM40_01555 [Maribacter sp.]|nr:MAG: hypothetical protein Unbinned4026contig1002_49 [Prokaryotic dsDNA virus sp.]HAI36907.1 hypothetical protein [Maribacter sp.]|tara:strand:- start:14183 stop:14572 length:390 start_codon:yes stop_codon:yes gene_type:complete